MQSPMPPQATGQGKTSGSGGFQGGTETEPPPDRRVVLFVARRPLFLWAGCASTRSADPCVTQPQSDAAGLVNSNNLSVHGDSHFARPNPMRILMHRTARTALSVRIGPTGRTRGLDRGTCPSRTLHYANRNRSVKCAGDWVLGQPALQPEADETRLTSKKSARQRSRLQQSEMRAAAMAVDDTNWVASYKVSTIK